MGTTGSPGILAAAGPCQPWATRDIAPALGGRGPFDAAPPAIPRLGAAHRERRGLAPAQPAA